MSRSRTGRRDRCPTLHGGHKRVRTAVQRVLNQATRRGSEAFHEVLADWCEERGLAGRAERLRRGSDLVLPVLAHGVQTRLRR